MTGDPQPLALTCKHAAYILGVTPNTIRRWADAGELSCIRTVGGQRRFSRAEIDRLIERLSRGGP
jgi:excisionase family DNA binding protein